MALMPGVFLYTVSYEPSPEPGGWYVTLIRLNITELRSGRATFGLGLLIPVPLHSPPHSAYHGILAFLIRKKETGRG